MTAAFLITWRESLEAALIVGILFTYLKKVGQEQNYKYIYAGVAAAFVAVIGLIFLSSKLGILVDEDDQEVIEVIILFLAMGILTHMVIWMSRNAWSIKGTVQQKVDQALAQRRLWILALLVFTAIFREGAEALLFLWGAFLQVRGSIFALPALTGGLLGIGAAILMSWALFKGFARLSLRPFFQVTGIVLIFIAAGMLSSGVGKLVEMGALPALVNPIWDTSRFLDEGGILGSLAAVFLGYRAHPALTQVLAYLFYFPPVLFWANRRQA